jgi:hypothetical protein
VEQGATYFPSVMSFAAKPDGFAGKVVGHRRAPENGLVMSKAGQAKDARAWKRALRTLPIPKGVYRFRTHQEADEWLWQMLTRPRR